MWCDGSTAAVTAPLTIVISRLSFHLLRFKRSLASNISAHCRSVSTVTMDMSSYQFVNTLAQCYEANAQLQGGGVAGGVAGGATDYYGMQYPSCYSPATQGYAAPGAGAAPGYTGMMAGAGGAAPPGPAAAPPPPSEYAPASSSTTSLSAPAPGSRRSPGPAPGHQTPGGGVTPAPLTAANVNMKYQDSNVGSPQDLSTTSSGGTPQPGAMPPGLKSPDSDIEDSEPTSPMSPEEKEGGASSSATSTKKEDSKSTPPQIYPWMKRVHLGQSKCPPFT